MKDFDKLARKLERNVYGSAKGFIRMELLNNDLEDFVPRFSSGGLRISDIGGGAGRFSILCARKGHSIRLSDISQEMLNLAEKEIKAEGLEERVSLIREDYLRVSPLEVHDLYCLHGCAEWIENSERALHKICGEMPSGAYLSLLIFNSDRLALKEGINGWLHPDLIPPKKRKLTPPGGLSPLEISEILSAGGGSILLQSGIRIFHKFFRQFDPEGVSDHQWLEQEAAWYRRAPFNGLGEHSHFIWKKD